MVLKNPNQWIRVLFLALKKRLIIANTDCKLKEISKEKREKWKGAGNYTKMYKQFLADQEVTINIAREYYKDALQKGIAKEQARCLLPEGNTLSRMYMNGTLRSWIHYLQIRTDMTTVQREHAQVAEAISIILKQEFPIIYSAFFGD